MLTLSNLTRHAHLAFAALQLVQPCLLLPCHLSWPLHLLLMSRVSLQSCGELLVYDHDDTHTWPHVTEKGSSRSNFPLGAMQV